MEEQYMKSINELEIIFKNLESKRDNMRKNNEYKMSTMTVSSPISNASSNSKSFSKAKLLKRECDKISKRIKRLENFEIALAKRMSEID
jgi:hypothetical protein